jgi:taurine dioxygenase
MNERVTIRSVSEAVGAEILDLDLAGSLPEPTIDEIRRALFQHGVVFFRDQKLTPEQHVAFAQRFGEINVNRFFKAVDGYPMIAEVRKEPEQKGNIGGNWHTDHSYDQAPAMGSILYAREVPETGGDTLFASMYAAYEALSERMKSYLDGLSALHDGEPIYRGLYANYGVADRPSYPHAEHPVVRTHPVTGKKALYVNRGFTRHILGIPRDESDAILAYLYDHAESPLFQCRFRWTENAIAFWDNRCTQHRAMWDYWPHTRAGTRVTVRGERPV